MIAKWPGVIYTLAGFEKETQKNNDCYFNFILSDGTRSTQRDENWPTNYTFMMQ